MGAALAAAATNGFQPRISFLAVAATDYNVLLTGLAGHDINCSLLLVDTAVECASKK